MAIELTNLTQARNNVPFNASEKEPKYTLGPGECLLIPDEYLKQLDADAQKRFERVISGTNPMFSVRRIDEQQIARLQAESAKRAQKKQKAEPPPPPAPTEQEQANGPDELPSQLP